jgi:hypothetical protein
MIRAVLVGYSIADWKLVRQPQWMAEVRRNPQSSQLTKRYFDLEETAYRRVLDRWDQEGAGSSLETAVRLLDEFGAIEIIRS